MTSDYCSECDGCGHEGCCSPLACAKKKMVGGKYCDIYYQNIAFSYLLAQDLYNDKDPKHREIFDKVYKEVYGD